MGAGASASAEIITGASKEDLAAAYAALSEEDKKKLIAATADGGKSNSAMEKVLAREGKPKVCILGGGNASHVYIALFGLRGYDVHVFADFGDEAERLNAAGGEITILDRCGADGVPGVTSEPTCSGKAKSISKEAADILPLCDVIMSSLPSFAWKSLLTKIKPHFKDGCVIYYLPGQGGADMITRGEIQEELDAGKVTFCAVCPMPFNCRIKEYGQSVDLAAFKEHYDLSAFPAKDAVPAAELLGSLLGKKVVPSGCMAAQHLIGLNPNIHPARCYGLWKDWDGKTPYAENPLFYETWDDAASKYADGISEERCGVWKAILKATDGKAGSEDDVIMLKDYINKIYTVNGVSKIPDASTTKGVFSTNPGYKGFRCPMKEVEGGFVPDFTNRYFSEDFPESFAIYKGLAELVGYSTPVIDEIFLWAQPFMGKEYVTGEPGSAKLNGKDLKETKSPQAFGYTTLEEFLGKM